MPTSAFAASTGPHFVGRYCGRPWGRSSVDLTLSARLEQRSRCRRNVMNSAGAGDPVMLGWIHVRRVRSPNGRGERSSVGTQFTGRALR